MYEGTSAVVRAFQDFFFKKIHQDLYNSLENVHFSKTKKYI